MGKETRTVRTESRTVRTESSIVRKGSMFVRKEPRTMKNKYCEERVLDNEEGLLHCEEEV